MLSTFLPLIKRLEIRFLSVRIEICVHVEYSLLKFQIAKMSCNLIVKVHPVVYMSMV